MLYYTICVNSNKHFFPSTHVRQLFLNSIVRQIPHLKSAINKARSFVFKMGN